MPTLVAIGAWDPVTASTATLLACSHDDPAVCMLGGNTWWPTIAKLPALRYDLFDGAFGSQITAPSSTISLQTEPWPYFGRYELADARIQIWHGALGDPASAYVLRFDGRVSTQPKLQDGRAEIDFAVDDRWLDTSLLTLYAGTTGVEGPAALKGQAKPLALGAPRYVSGKLIDSVNSVFQVSAYGAVNGFEAALEKLARFPAPVADYPSYAALVAASIPAGQWATAVAVGMARFGAPPTGQISFLLQGDAAGTDGWARTAGKLIRRLAILSGGAGKIDDASLNALDAARPYNVSIYIDAQTTAREVIQKLAASVNAVAGVSWTGQLFVAPVGVGAATVTLAADGSSLPAVSSVQQIDIASPFQKLAIDAERAWTVHDLADIAFTATVIDLGLYATATSYREGNVVNLSDGSRWLFVATTPAAGSAPATGNANWSRLTGPTAAVYGDGTSIEVLKPAQAGADRTAANTAAGIAGQGAFATISSAAYGSSFLTGFGALAPLASILLGSNYLFRQDGSTKVTDATAITALGTASAIAGQGAFATLSSAGYGSSLLTGFGALAPLASVALGSSYLRRADGSTTLTEALAITSLGTAAAIAGQGAWATTSLISPQAVAVPAGNLVYNAGLKLRSEGWVLPSTMSWVSGGSGEGAFFVSTSNGTQVAFSNTFAVAAGTTLTTQSEMFAGGITAGTMYTRLVFFDSGGSVLGYSPYAYATLGAGWALYSSTGTAPAKTVTAALQFVLDSVTNTNAAFRRGKVSNFNGITPFSDEATTGSLYGDGTSIRSLRPAEANANVTESRTAAAISGQGAFATLSSAAYGSSLLTGFGPLSPLASIALGQSYIRRADGSTTLTEALAITYLGTAAAIAGQAATATSSDFAAITGPTKPDPNATKNAVAANMLPSPALLDRAQAVNGAVIQRVSNGGKNSRDNNRIYFAGGAGITYPEGGVGTMPVVPGETLYSQLSVYFTASGLTFSVNIQFFDASNNYVTTLSMGNGPTASQTNVWFSTAIGKVIVPANSASVRLEVAAGGSGGDSYAADFYLGRQTPGADVTNANTAAAISGQGPAATLSTVTDLIALNDTNTYTGSGSAGAGSASGGSGGSTSKQGSGVQP